ncbi:MAG: nucleotidyltransferase family protein [Oscillospiraceae bacterium]|nr:nucleotidyltransferase family protein [Oscillospiraceae bacterium]
MNHMQKGVIMLIKSAITGEAQPLPEGFSIDEAYGFIVKHKIMMLAYDGAVRCGIPKENPTMQKLFQSYIQGLLYSEKQMKAVSEIYSAFDENGIDYLPLKGCNMKYLYPKPELRLMGDADILIKEEQYIKIKKVLSELGYSDLGIISNHYVWDSPELHIEAHISPMPASNQKFYDYYGKGWAKAHKSEGCRYIYSKEDSFIFLFIHFARHYLDGGIGIRHAADIFVYMNNFCDMDYSYIEEEMEKLGILKFYKNVLTVLDYWFKNGNVTDSAKIVSDFIMESGNWGSFESSALATGHNSFLAEEKVSGTKGKNFFNEVFPNKKIMTQRYSWVDNKTLLMPAAWVARWVDAIIFRRKNIKIKVKKIKMMNDEKIDEYRDNLRKSGFDI